MSFIALPDDGWHPTCLTTARGWDVEGGGQDFGGGKRDHPTGVKLVSTSKTPHKNQKNSSMSFNRVSMVR